MPEIIVYAMEGRTVEQKRALVKELTDGFVKTCGSTPEQVIFVINDVAKSDWATAGVLAMDTPQNK